jgi:hypothetical protein
VVDDEDSLAALVALALLGDKVVPSLAEQEFPNDKEQATHWEEDCDCSGDGDCDYSVCILCDCSDCNHVVDDEDSLAALAALAPLTPLAPLALLGDKVVPSLAEQEFPNNKAQATHWEEDCDCTGDGDCDYSVWVLFDCSDCNHVVDDEDSLSLGSQLSKLNPNAELNAELHAKDGDTTAEGSSCTNVTNVTTRPPLPLQIS